MARKFHFPTWRKTEALVETSAVEVSDLKLVAEATEKQEHIRTGDLSKSV